MLESWREVSKSVSKIVDKKYWGLKKICKNRWPGKIEKNWKKYKQFEEEIKGNVE